MKKYDHHPASLLLPGILLVCLIALLSGCIPDARKLKKTQEYLHNNPGFAADYCAEQYPVKDSMVVRDSVHFDTLYLETLYTDTVISNGDTVYLERVLPAKTIIKTITRDSIIYRRDAAQEHRLQLALEACHGNTTILLNKNTSLEAQLLEWKGKAKTRWRWLALLIGGALAYTGFRIYSKFQKPKIKV